MRIKLESKNNFSTHLILYDEYFYREYDTRKKENSKERLILSVFDNGDDLIFRSTEFLDAYSALMEIESRDNAKTSNDRHPG